MDRYDTLREAIAAFDAGNHAWGRFYRYTLRRYRGDLPAPDPLPVRAALQDAVLLAPPNPDHHTLGEFRDAVRTALQAVRAFIDAASPALRTGDLLLAPEAFAEALDLLDEAMRET